MDKRQASFVFWDKMMSTTKMAVAQMANRTQFLSTRKNALMTMLSNMNTMALILVDMVMPRPLW